MATSEDRSVPHLVAPHVSVRAHYEDRHERRVANWLTPWDFESQLDVGIMGAGQSSTSILPTNCWGAPDAFRLALPGFTTYSPDFDVDIADLRVRDLGDVAIPVMDPRAGLANIEAAAEAVLGLSEDLFLITIGGDHAVTPSVARAFARTRTDGRVGLIHIDAHNDVRVMDHGPTNGTPMRQLLESGLGFSGNNFVQVGIHGFMNASYYKRWVEGRGGTIFSGRSVRRTGIQSIAEQSMAIAGEGVDAIYVTVDVDVLESAYTPGTGAATPEGMHPMDLYELLFLLGQNPLVKGIDFVEHDPSRDVANITGRATVTAVLTFLAGLYLREKGQNGWRGYDPSPITD